MLSYRKLILIFVFLLLVVSSPLAQDNVLRSTGCLFRMPRGVEIDCMWLTVPENRNNPDSNSITLSIAILRHPSNNPEPDPIIFLQGGPGGVTLDTLYLSYESRYESLFAANRDIILFDQRGIGASLPSLDCPVYRSTEINLLDYINNGQFVTRPAIEAILNEALVDCGHTLFNHYDLNGYNSVQNAADIEAIRVALGYEQVNLWGISYGSRLALTAMRDYPDSFRRIVLDGVYPLEANIYTELPVNFDRSLQVLFDNCARDIDCNRAYPDLEAVLFDTVRQLNEQPVRFNAPSPLTNEIFQGVFYDGDLMLHTLFQLLYASDLLSRLPELIYDVSEGDFGIWILHVGYLAGWRDNITTGMNYAVQCQEEFYFTGAGSIQEAWEHYPRFGSYSQRIEFFEPMTAICSAFNTDETPILENQAVHSDIPTLLMAGEYDPITPPRWAIQVQEQLSNSQYLEFEAHGHGPSASGGCAHSIMVDFFRLDDISSLDTTCMDDIEMQFSGTRPNDFRDFDSADSSVSD